MGTGFGAGASIPTLASAVRAVVAHRAATPTAGNAGQPSITTGSKTRARAGWSRTAADAESGWSQKDIQNLSVAVDCSDFNCRKISRPIYTLISFVYGLMGFLLHWKFDFPTR